MKKIALIVFALVFVAAGCNQSRSSQLIEKETLAPDLDLREVEPSAETVPTQRVTPKPTSKCHPSYSGCVPIASDVDCVGGSGNGPSYVSGPLSVVGVDVYDLDRDNDGIACE